MKLEVTAIPSGYIHTVYPVLVPYIQKAAEWTLGRQGVDEISASLFSKDTQLWVVFEEKDHMVYGYVLTEIRNYPTARHFIVLNCGGVDGYLESCIDQFLDLFEKFAIDNGCDGMEFQGRPAWGKFVKERGFEKPYHHYFKSLK